MKTYAKPKLWRIAKPSETPQDIHHAVLLGSAQAGSLGAVRCTDYKGDAEKEITFNAVRGLGA